MNAWVMMRAEPDGQDALMGVFLSKHDAERGRQWATDKWLAELDAEYLAYWGADVGAKYAAKLYYVLGPFVIGEIDLSREYGDQ